MKAPRFSVVVPVYNGGTTITETLHSLVAQNQPAEIIVVNDGSSDDTAEKARTFDRVRVISLERNSGRSVARNVGAAAANGSVLLFLDNDRIPQDSRFLEAHASLLDEGAAGTCGPVEALGSDFWARYQRRVPASRGSPVALSEFSSANFSIRTELFRAVGGFDERYRRYGFEDRELYQRLLERGMELLSCPDACAAHSDQLDLAKIWAKLFEAGGDSAARFRHDHPEVYRTMRYARVDAREHPGLRPIGWLLSRLLPASLPATERLLQWERLPYAPRRRLAQIYSAAAFLAGSSRHSGG